MQSLTIGFQNITTSTEQQSAAAIEALLQKYLRLWALLSPKEWNGFIVFVQSPIHKDNRYSAKLIERIKEALRKGSKALRGDELITKYTSARTIDGMAIKLQKLEQAFKTLITLIRQYMAYVEMADHPLMLQQLLVQNLKRRQNNEVFQEAVEQLDQLLKREPLSLLIAADQWWLANQRYYHQYAEQFSDHTLFRKNLEAFDELYQLGILRNYLEGLNRGLNLTEEDDYDLRAQVKAMWGRGIMSTPVAELYQLMIQVLELGGEKGLELYAQFDQTYVEKNRQLAPIDRFILTKVRINYLGQMYYETGEVSWLKQAFEWMQYACTEELYDLEGTISDDEYLNYAVVAQALGEGEAYQVFAQKYQNYLDPSIREQVLGLCNAYLLRDQGKRDAALKELDDFFPMRSQEELKYNLRAKDLRVMLYYEQMVQEDNNDASISALTRSLDNLSKFCKRLIQNSILKEDAVRPHQRFRKIVQVMDRWHGQTEAAKRQEALEELEVLMTVKDVVANRMWLKREIDRIKGLN